VEIAALGDRAAEVPSVIFMREDSQILTGDAARRRAAREPTRVAREFKRRVGDPTPILVGGTPMSSEALMAKLLRWVVDRVAEQEGGLPDMIGISRPANWSSYKQDLLGEVVRLADLDVPITTLTEPEAAATYYASTERVESDDNIAVYDLGGGTFDACVLTRRGDGFDVLGTPEGVEHLGGIDFDEAVFRYVLRQADGAVDSLDQSDPAVIAALARLREDCVEAKEGLSTDSEVSIPVLLPNAHTQVDLTRSEFEAMIQTPVSASIAALRRALQSAVLQPSQVRAILLVGGSSRIPLVGRMVSEALAQPVTVDAHPKHAVALGAAHAAAAAKDPGQAPAVSTAPGAGPAAAAATVAGAATGAEPAEAAPTIAASGAAPPTRAAPPGGGPPGGPGEQPPGPGGKAGSAGAAFRRRRVALAGGALAVVAAILVAVLALGGGDDKKNTGAVAPPPTGPATKGPWRALPNTPTARQQVASTHAAGSVWVMGGLTGSTSTRAVEGFDPVVNSWKSGPDLPLPLHHAMAVTYKNEIVVMGGWIPKGGDLIATTSNRVFAQRGSSWAELPRMKRPRAAAAAAVVSGKIVVVGGQDAAGKLIKTAEVFDGKQWQDGADMPTPREHLAAADDDKFVYAVGGRALSSDKNTGALERYDPEADEWSKLPDMPTPRGGLGAVVSGGKVIAVGGEEPTVVLKKVEGYDIASQTWSKLPDLPKGRHGLGVAHIGLKVYAIDGAQRPGHESSTNVAEVLTVEARKAGSSGDGDGAVKSPG
jgi:N-acetylneuraminic acid mutarotase/actin-like ATPase involved in cell morphogenesis